MRTTLHIDDDVYVAARSLAAAGHRSIGKVLSELARRGLASRPYDIDDGLPTFVVREGTAPLTNEMVKGALDDER